MSRDEQTIRNEIFSLVKEFYQVKFADQTFSPGKDDVRYAGRVFDHCRRP